MKKLLSFHGKQEVKDKYISRVKAHSEADEIVKGQYWERGKGCAVGCTIEGSDHSKYEKELGIPEILAHLEDGLFEALPNDYAKTFPLKFLEAIPVGVDLSKVFTKLVIWEWEDSEYGLKNIPEIAEDVELIASCEQVVNLYKRILEGEEVSISEWDAAESVAYEIERARAGAGARAGAWAGAWARAWARAGAGAGAWARARAGAWAGAWARARAGAGAGARARAGAGAGAEYEKQLIVTAEKLLELLRNA